MNQGGSDPVSEAVSQWGELRPDLDFTVMGIWGRLSRVVFAQRSVFDERHRAAGLSTGAFDLLANLRRSEGGPGKTPTELARTSVLSIGSISQKLQKLVEAGLVVRSGHSTDRRYVYFQLSDEGVRLVDGLIDGHIEEQRRLLGDFSEQDLAMLDEWLARVQRSVEQHSSSPPLAP